MTEYKPPPMPSLAELLLQMTDCVVSANINGGNPHGNNQHKRKLKQDFEKKKSRKRGRDIVLRRQYNMEKI